MPTPTAEPEPQKGKVEAAGSLAQMFAQRAPPPPEPVPSSSGEDTRSTSEASSSRGGPGRGAALAGLFAGRGAGPGLISFLSFNLTSE
jgi:hypothetical protein